MPKTLTAASTDRSPLGTDAHSIERLETLISDALASARQLGANAAEAAVTTSSGLSLNVRLGEVETIEHTRDKGLGISVYFDQHKGSASTTDFTPDAIRDTVQSACSIARYTSADDCAGLADADRMAAEIPDLDLHHPWEPSTEAVIDLATRTEAAAREADPRISNSEGAGVSHQQGLYAYGNSHGFLATSPGSRHSISCTVIASDESGMQRDYWYSIDRNPANLESGEAIGRQAAERSLRRLGARKPKTCTTPVIYSAEVARGLFRHLTGAISGSSQYRKASFLLDHVGQQIFPSFMHIHEQPHIPGALGSAAFDSEGVATVPRDLVSDGVLQGYILDSYSARKLGLATTGNAGGVHNLCVDATAGDLPSLLKTLHQGLYITELMGFGINMVSGDYSRGASGFWVEDGEISYPVEEITVAGNLRDMFMNIQAVGNDIDTRGNIRTGSVLLDQLIIAGS